MQQIEVVNFTRNMYGGGTQNWAITQDQNNRIYVANNEGILVYNGTIWESYPVSNKTIVRNLIFGADGKLYVGAQDEFGYYYPNKIGKLKFNSLKYLLSDKDQKFADVWQVVSMDNDIFFRTDTKIFKFNYKNKNITTYPTNTAWLSLHKHQGKILAHDKKLGLLIYQNKEWLPFITKDLLPANFLITDVTPYKKDTSLVSTVNNGLYLLTQKELKSYILKSENINIDNQQHFTSLCVIDNDNFFVGTYFNGIYKISKEGNIVSHISTKNNIPNNTIRCLFVDNYKNIWAGLDNGIIFFTYNNAIKHINPPIFNNGVGYDTKILRDNLYFALSTGLLSVSTQSKPDADIDLSTITQAPKIILNGLTWNISLVDNLLLTGRDDGLFALNNQQQLTPISQSTGYWTCLEIGQPQNPQSQNAQKKIVAGNYFGADFFEINNENLINVGKIENFEKIKNFGESSRYIAFDKENIWISHPYRGIYRIKIADKTIKLFSQKDGLPANLDNHVFKVKGEIIFATPKGIYKYDAVSEKFLSSEKYAKIFEKKPIRYIKEDNKGNLWFVQDKMLGVVDFGGKNPVIHYIPELKNKIISGFENIFPYNAQNILIGGETGFYHLNYKKYVENIKPFDVYVSQIKTSGIVDSVLFGGYDFDNKFDKKIEKNINIPYQLNSLLFSYTSSIYGQLQNVEYSHYLEGFDKDWSEWNHNTEKEYTNIPAGTYIFKVKARKSPSHQSIIYEFTFTINSPWYQTTLAYIFYGLFFVGFMFGTLKYQSLRHKKRLEKKQFDDLKKFEAEQKQQAYQHQIELTKSESEITHLRNEKLDAEIKHKNTELANVTMNLVQKKEFILKLKKELQTLQKNVKIGDENTELKKILKLLSEEEKVDDEWDNFSLHFNSVHGDFLTILKKKHTDLTPHDLRLCAYLRMNLSSKEIMPLMGISLRGVEISRYRLRKKLALPTETNLVEHLLNLKINHEY